MAAFRQFEIEAIRILTAGTLSPETLELVEQAPNLNDYTYTGCGYFATLRHELLPSRRIVCHAQRVVGECDGVKAGFIVFLENHELVLECHDWGEKHVPENFREQKVRVVVET